MPLDKFGNRYEVIPAVGSTKYFTVQFNYKEEEPHKTTKSPCHSNTSVCDVKPNGAEYEGEGLKANTAGSHGSMRATLAAVAKDKLPVSRQLLLKDEKAAEGCQEGRVIHSDEAPATYEEWFDRPGEVDTLGDIWIREDVFGIGY